MSKESLEKAQRDYKALLLGIVKQSMDEYIKLQHPRYRKKGYLQDAFESSVEMFFDDSFRFLYLKNEDGEMMSLQDLLSMFVSSKNMEIKKIKEHLITESKMYWENKLINVIDIPSALVYDGHVYLIEHSSDTDYQIDYEAKIISLNMDSNNSDNQQTFVAAASEVMLYHENVPIQKKYIPVLGKALFRLLKMNSCFLES